MSTLVSRRQKRILEFFIFALFLLWSKSALTLSLHNLLRCPDSESAAICNDRCTRAGLVGFLVTSDELKINKQEASGTKNFSFKNCDIKNSYEWLCNQIQYNRDQQIFEGYRIVQMENGTFSEQSIAYDSSSNKWREIYGCAKVTVKHGNIQNIN